MSHPPISAKDTNADKISRLYKLADEPAIVNTSPVGDETLGRVPFQGIPSIAATASGERVFLAWYGDKPTEEPGNYIMVAFDDKSAQKWTDVALTIKSPHPEVRLFDPTV